MSHDNTYAQLLRHVLDNGDGHDDRTGVGTTSVFGYQCRYDLSEGFPLLTTKKMAWKSIQTELRWFLLGRTDNQWLKDHGCSIWDEWATKEQCAKFGREEGDLGLVYGHQWTNFGATHMSRGRTASDGVDQIKNLCNDLEKNPNSRRMIVTGWNPAEATQVALPPCHTLWQCKVREKRIGPVMESKDCETPHTVRYLDLQLYQRSADSFLGVPFNIASYALLTHLLAKAHGFIPGVFIHTFGDLHVYNNHITQVREQLSRVPFQSPSITVDIGKGFDGLRQWANTGEGVTLVDYQHHDAIKASVAI